MWSNGYSIHYIQFFLMRKYLFLISLSIYIQSCFVAYANTTVGWVGTSIPAIATECPTEAVGARTKHGIPSANVSPAPTSGSQTCITHYYYASSDHPVAVTYNNG